MPLLVKNPIHRAKFFSRCADHRCDSFGEGAGWEGEIKARIISLVMPVDVVNFTGENRPLLLAQPRQHRLEGVEGGEVVGEWLRKAHTVRSD